MLKIELPFWLQGVELLKMVAAAQRFWERIEAALRWPLGQLDPLTCEPGILDLLAYQRDIQRLRGEPLDLYRLRVKYALVNAQDAGSKYGFVQIFRRLGIGYLEQEERVDPVDWDVILLHLSDSQIAQNTELLMQIIRAYGRTCRRYQLTTITPIPVYVAAFEAGHVYSYSVARAEAPALVEFEVSVFAAVFEVCAAYDYAAALLDAPATASVSSMYGGSSYGEAAYGQ